MQALLSLLTISHELANVSCKSNHRNHRRQTVSQCEGVVDFIDLHWISDLQFANRGTSRRTAAVQAKASLMSAHTTADLLTIAASLALSGPSLDR